MTALAEPPIPAPVAAPPIPRDIADKLRRGRTAMRKDAALRRMCQKFWEGEPYWYVNSRNQLRVLPTALIDVTGQKPDHRVRNVYNFAASIVEGKVSASSQKIPGYQVDPASSDPEDIAGARIAQQVCFYGWDEWHKRRLTIKAITTTLVQRESFTVPYFDPNVGPFTLGPDGWEGQGNIKHLHLSRGEVMWEPDVDFDESRWHGTEQATLLEQIRAIPGYIGGALKGGASTADLPGEKRNDEMGVLTQYLERPSKKYPQGRRAWLSDNRVIVDYRRDPECPPDWTDWWEPYPYLDADGNVVDEPIPHRLSYTVNPDGDDLGLMERLIDLARTINDCWNKIVEWKNRALMPQRMAPRGSNLDRGNDVPGATFYYNLVGGQKPEWERVNTNINELIQILELALDQMRQLAADVDVQPDPNLAAKTANAAIEANLSRWQSFLGDVEEWHSRLARHELAIVARYFTSERIMEIRGIHGWEDPAGFTGAQLPSQINVRVMPGSIEAVGRQQTMTTLQFLQVNWPGSVSVEAAQASILSGSLDSLLNSSMLDKARAWSIVKAFRQGPAAMARFAPRVDPELWEPGISPLPPGMVPGWMPRLQDNIAIHKQVVGDAMKEPLFFTLPPETQHMFDLYWSALEFVEQRDAAHAAMQEAQVAQATGMANATRPAPPAVMPSQPSVATIGQQTQQ